MQQIEEGCKCRNSTQKLYQPQGQIQFPAALWKQSRHIEISVQSHLISMALPASKEIKDSSREKRLFILAIYRKRIWHFRLWKTEFLPMHNFFYDIYPSLTSLFEWVEDLFNQNAQSKTPLFGKLSTLIYYTMQVVWELYHMDPKLCHI